ncbi:MAG: NAD-dependent epimerase/dehydratase family protein [Chloroflexota bacterium]
MKVFLTGASGFTGTHLTNALALGGHQVTIIARNPKAADGFSNKGIKILAGDISEKEKMKAGMDGSDWVFHLAAYAKPTSLDKDLPFMTNVEGTRNVIEAAKASGVRKVVFTSTAGTMGFSRDGMPVGEETNRNIEYNTEYEKTKAEAEKIAMSSSTTLTEIVIVNPTRIFGPGKLGMSNSVTRIIKLYGAGLWRIIPGDGTAIGNYAFIDDVVKGHILAAQHGKGGERYILGGENVSFESLFDELGRAYGRKRRMIRLSESAMKMAARISESAGSVVGKPALISGDWIDKYLQNWIMSSNKAIKDLSYSITPFEEALKITVRWLLRPP